MARRARLLLLLAVVAALAVATAQVHASASDGGDESGVGGMRRWLDDLNATDTATNLTSSTGFISYDALLADIVPCSVPGASYYNCRPGAEANPYERGCSAITQCRD